MADKKSLPALLKEIRACRVCEKNLPMGPRPILSANAKAKIVIVGQAPGRKVHLSGIPWNDPSGNRLREWLKIEKKDFYNPQKVALVPMGFCYPGSTSQGDKPPRPECAPLWHEKIFSNISKNHFLLLIGNYAQGYYLPKNKKNLTQTVKSWKSFLPNYFPLPHPSPRNQRWFKKNPWFERKCIPELRKRVHRALNK